MTGTDVGPETQLSNLFGSYRAEWLRDQMFELFTSPVYFPELITRRPCMLVGGRGTGKTTVLRALAYEGQQRLTGTDGRDLDFYGIYYRVNTNRVRALQGPELDDDDWQDLFAHYFNLIMCERLAEMATLFATSFDQPSLGVLDDDWALVGRTLGVEVNSLTGLLHSIKHRRVEFETYVNNIIDQPRPTISLQGLPIDTLVETLTKSARFAERPIFLIIDEYENLLDTQQQVVNTLIKHASDAYTFKIGVRELGWRQRTTLNNHEQLRSPADFVRIDIDEKLRGAFPDFAAKVCDERISRMTGPVAEKSLKSVRELFPRLTEDDEGELQSIGRKTSLIREQLELEFTEDDIDRFDALPPLYQYMIDFWAQGHRIKLADAYSDYLSRPSTWDTRYGNYKHSLLYTLRRGRRGIQKYFAGHDTIAEVAGTNIRFYLQLVEQMLLTHLSEGKTLASPVSPAIQTTAAQRVGQNNLGELEGLSTYGMYLSRIVLGLGRIFQVMAAEPDGHTPEVTQFHIVQPARRKPAALPMDREQLPLNVDTLMTEAVMHLALVRLRGTKPSGPSDTEEYDYMLHPIFSPLFSISYRQKRKMAITKEQLAALVQRPRVAIRDVLSANKRGLPLEEDLPDQLNLFDAFYNADE